MVASTTRSRTIDQVVAGREKLRGAAPSLGEIGPEIRLAEEEDGEA
jgi:hypothetical protein